MRSQNPFLISLLATFGILAGGCQPTEPTCGRGATAVFVSKNNGKGHLDYVCKCDSTAECVGGERCGWSSQYQLNVCSDIWESTAPGTKNPCDSDNGGCLSTDVCNYDAKAGISCTPPPKPTCGLTCSAGQKLVNNAGGGCFCAPTCVGVKCGTGQTCQLGLEYGTCVDNCRAPYKDCGGKCIMTTLDNDNCGACGVICGPGSACQGGTCNPIPGPMELVCHGMEFTMAQGSDDHTIGTVTRGYNIRGEQAWSISAPNPGVNTAAPNGICAVTTLSRAGTETVRPLSGSAVWVPGGTMDVPRYSRPGCNRLRWHAPGDPFAKGFAWDGYCEE